MRQKMKQLTGILLSFVMVLGLMPGMGLTAYADDDPPYAGLKNTTTVIHFDSKDWYLIDYDASTVTLLSKECVGASQFDSNGESNSYSGSTVEEFVNNWYEDKISTDAKTAVNGGMFLLTTDQAETIQSANVDVLKCDEVTGTDGWWWLRSAGFYDTFAACVFGEDGDVDGEGYLVDIEFGVRPALKLNLESVIFSSEDKTFTLKPAEYRVTITPGSNMTKTADSGEETQTGLSGAMTSVVYTANDGYYFPEDYTVADVNGISVTRISDTQITVSGTPTDDAAILLTDPTAYVETEVYTELMNNETVVKFNDYSWFIIEDNSGSATEGTVTLLAADTSFGKSVFSQNKSNSYNNSDVKDYLDQIVAGTAEEGKPNFKDVADAIQPVALTTYEYDSTTEVSETTENAKLYLLDTATAKNLSENILSYSGIWWLRSPGSRTDLTACVLARGRVTAGGRSVGLVSAIRPALKLDLSSVVFSSEDKTFTLKPAGYNVTITPGSNMTKTADSGEETQTGLSGAMTSVVYTANDGYYFPQDYTVADVNGISVTRNSYTQITVSGTPDDDAEIILTAPTAYTDKEKYTELMNKLTVVKFNDYNWYIIEDNSTGAAEGTVTLLAADDKFGSSVFSNNGSNAYSSSIIRTKLDEMTAAGGSFSGVADAIQTVKVKGSGSDTEVDAKLYLLSTEEARKLDPIIRKYNFPGAEQGNWWLRTAGSIDHMAGCVSGMTGSVYGDGGTVNKEFGVRPALKLDLSKVSFSSDGVFSIAEGEHQHTFGTNPRWLWRFIDGKAYAEATYSCGCGETKTVAADVKSADNGSTVTYTATDKNGKTNSRDFIKTFTVKYNNESTDYAYGATCRLTAEEDSDWTVIPGSAAASASAEGAGGVVRAEGTKTFYFPVTESVTVVAQKSTEAQEQTAKIDVLSCEGGQNQFTYKVFWSLPEGAQVKSTMIYRCRDDNAQINSAEGLLRASNLRSYNMKLNVRNGEFNYTAAGLTSGSKQTVMAQVVYTLKGTEYIIHTDPMNIAIK